MTLVVFMPAIAAAILATIKDLRHCLVWFALPCMLLLPNFYTHKLAAIPVGNFHNYLFAVLLIAAVVGKERRLLRLNFTDVLILSFSLYCVYSEYENKGFVMGRNMLAVKMMGVLAPYYLGKMIAKDNGFLCGTILMMVVLGAFVGLVSPYEARFGRNPFDFWRSYWPTPVPWDGALYRFGLRRVAGPFAHPICQGFFYSMIIPLGLWLWNVGIPGRSAFRRILGLGLFMGLFLPGSRGPWIGAFLALSFPALLWQRSRVFLCGVLAVLALLVGVLFMDQFIGYASIERGQAQSEAQETAAYRWEMLENYMEVVNERPLIGYGKDEIPVVKGLRSIDNQYLFLSLIHGLPAAIMFLASIIIPAVLLLFAALSRPWNEPMARLGIVIAGVLLGAIVTQTTVFAGSQTEQVLFLLIGFAATLRARLVGHEKS